MSGKLSKSVSGHLRRGVKPGVGDNYKTSLLSVFGSKFISGMSGYMHSRKAVRKNDCAPLDYKRLATELLLGDE